MSSFSIKKGDLVPAITATLLQNNTPIDLTTATGVRFAMRARGVTKIDGAAAIVSAAAGTVKYQWVGTDTDTADVYQVEWQITWPAGKQTIPNSGYDTVTVTGDIAT